MRPLTAILTILGMVALGLVGQPARVLAEPSRGSGESKAEAGPLAGEATAATFREPTKPHFKLFLLIGQSNMAGRGPIENRDRQAHPRVFKLDATNNWIAAADPLHFDKPDVDGVGPGKTFGEQIAAAYPDELIGLIPCAVGGTTIQDWLNSAPGGCYDMALQRTRVAMLQGTLAGILWHQGESDITNAGSYVANATTFFAKLRKDLGVKNVPIVVGTIGSFVPNAVQINTAIRNLPWKVSFCGLAENWGLKSQGDNLHFDSVSYRTLGKRYADKWIGLAKLQK